MFFHCFIFPFYNKFVKCLAYGPWGPIHQISIFVFRKLYNIASPTKKFATLGDFFLRLDPIQIAATSLVSPAEAAVIEGPQSFTNDSITVKGLRYFWSQMPELQNFNTTKAIFWNLYLAPHNYHWVHSPAAGSEVQVFWHRGRTWPVNAWGRRKSPALYAENERFTYRFLTEEYGWVLLICVGALAVSSFLAGDKNVTTENFGAEKWLPFSSSIEKGQRLLGFKMGSSVLLVTEKAPGLNSFRKLGPMLKVGDALR